MRASAMEQRASKGQNRRETKSSPVLLFMKPAGDGGQMRELFRIQPLCGLGQRLQTGRVMTFRGEKLLRRDAEILADIKKDGHRGIIDAVFNVVDGSGALPERQTHIPRRNALLQSKLHQPVDKLLLFHGIAS